MTIYFVVIGGLLSAAGLMGFALASDLFEKVICSGIMLIGIGLSIVGVQVSARKKE